MTTPLFHTQVIETRVKNDVIVGKMKKKKTDFERPFSDLTSNSFTCSSNACNAMKRRSESVVHIERF